MPTREGSKTVHKLWLLRHRKTGEYAATTAHSNEDGEYCNSIDVRLDDTTTDPLKAWAADSALHAAYVREWTTPWYNSGPDSPSHNLTRDDWDIVEVEVVVTTSTTPVEATPPTREEYLTLCYGPNGRNPEPRHLAMLLASPPNDRVQEAPYTWTDWLIVERDLERKKSGRKKK